MEPLGGINEFVYGIELSFDTNFSRDRQSGGRGAFVQRFEREFRNTDATGLSISPETRGQIEELKKRAQTRAASGASSTFASGKTESTESGAASTSSPKSEESGKGTDAAGIKLSEEEKQQVDELKARDHEVRTHEQAHMSAGGGVSVSGPAYSYQKGPDGRMYAVGGEVQIDTSEGSTPEETISRARSIRAAAGAPARPSGQDRSVAAEASRMEAEARQELAEQRRTEQTGKNETGPEAAGQPEPGSESSVATAQAVAPAPSDTGAEGIDAGGRRSLSAPEGMGSSQVPSYGVSSGEGWIGPASGDLQRGPLRSPVDPNAEPGQQTMSRAAAAYQNMAPAYALAPMGMDISLAV